MSSIEQAGTIDRTLRMLQALAELGEFTPKELALHAGIPTSTAYRMTQSLGAVNFVEKAEHGRYRVGRQLLRLSGLIISRFDYAAIAHPHLQDLSDKFQETCAFALYLPTEYCFTILDSIGAMHPLQYVVQKNVPRPMVRGALGRSMLPYLPLADVEEALRRQGQFGEFDGPPMERDELLAEFETVLRQGCFVATSPSPLGVNGTAAPVFNSRGQLLGSVGITVPVIRYDEGLQPDISRSVVLAAKRIGDALGFAEGKSATTSDRPLRIELDEARREQ